MRAGVDEDEKKLLKAGFEKYSIYLYIYSQLLNLK